MPHNNVLGSGLGLGEGETLLRAEEAALFLGVAAKTLEKWRTKGGGPKYLRYGRSVRYKASELQAFMDRREFGSTSEEEKMVGPKVSLQN
jgi:predicted DNA-binding transcriptional regulator AlpA